MAKLTNEPRRAPLLLARSPNGCTEALMLAYGFRFTMLAELAIDRLLRVDTHSAHAEGRQKMIAWMQITAAGRKAIAEAAKSAEETPEAVPILRGGE